MNQLLDDKLEFQHRFCQFTGISELKVSKFLRENAVRTLFEHPEAIDPTPKQLGKIHDLMRLYGLYNNLKTPVQAYNMGSSGLAGQYFVNLVGSQRDREYFYCAMLNTQNEVIHTSTVHVGTLNEAPVYPREIVFEALRYGAHAIILAHNHPGGSTTPSGPDIDVTKRLVTSLKHVSIPVVDHIIVANGQYTSMAEQGTLYNIQQQVSAEQAKGYSVAGSAPTIAERMEAAKAVLSSQGERSDVNYELQDTQAR